MSTPTEHPEFMGTKELAELLGWTSGHVSEYLRRGKLPEPAFRIAAGPVWRSKDMYAWSVVHKLGSDDPKQLHETYGIAYDEPLGESLALQGLISEAEAHWLETKMRSREQASRDIPSRN